MNISRIALAAVGAFVAYFIVGGATFALVPSLKTEFLKYPAVYRDHDGQMSHMPTGMAAIFLSIAVLAVLYAMQCQAVLSMAEGARRRDLRCPHRPFRDRLLCAAQLRKPEYWVEADPAASSRLFHGVADRRHSDWTDLSSADALADC